MYKSRRCPPALASCPAPSPTAPGPPRGVGGCRGSQSHGGAQGTCPARPRPLLPAAPLPQGWGKPDKGETPIVSKLSVGLLLLEGGPLLVPAHTKRGWGVEMSPIPTPQVGRAGAGRGCMHTASAFGGKGTGYGCHPAALGKLRHSEGHSLTRGLCLAELRQGPALSTRLKQRKTASRVCMPMRAATSP